MGTLLFSRGGWVRGRRRPSEAQTHWHYKLDLREFAWLPQDARKIP